MILGLHITLNPLSLVRTPLMNVCSRLVTPDKRQSSHFGGIEQGIYRRCGTVDDLENTVWNTCFLC
jgi:hypothetical protein